MHTKPHPPPQMDAEQLMLGIFINSHRQGSLCDEQRGKNSQDFKLALEAWTVGRDVGVLSPQGLGTSINNLDGLMKTSFRV